MQRTSSAMIDNPLSQKLKKILRIEDLPVRTAAKPTTQILAEIVGTYSCRDV